MESVKPLAIPESLHRKLKAMSVKRDIPLKTLVVELLLAAITKSGEFARFE